MSAVRDCFFSTFAATLHIWRPFLHPQTEDALCSDDRGQRFILLLFIFCLVFHFQSLLSFHLLFFFSFVGLPPLCGKSVAAALQVITNSLKLGVITSIVFFFFFFFCGASPYKYLHAVIETLRLSHEHFNFVEY